MGVVMLNSVQFGWKIRYFFVYFFGGLECVGHSFAYVAHL
jgi:hypothetical protein